MTVQAELETNQEEDEAELEAIEPFRLGWSYATFRASLWAKTWLAWLAYFAVPLATGWLLKQAFDALERRESITRLLVLIGISEMVRFVIFGVAIWLVVRWWSHGLTLLRTNLLHAQTVSGGPHRADLPLGPAEALSRFNDDGRNALLWADSWLDGLSNLAYSVGAVAIMATIDGRAALVTLVPLFGITLLLRYVRPIMHEAAVADREAAGTVSSFLGETFAGMLAFRLAGREEAAIERLESHTERRRHTAVRNLVIEQSVDGMTSTTTDLTIGLILLVLVPRVRTGEISVGDVALFVTYAIQLGEAPRFLARLITAREQVLVSFRRMGELLPPGRLDDLVRRRPITIEPGDTMLERDPDPDRIDLERLRVQGLTAFHPSTGGGIHDIDLDIAAGDFVVITGPVGSGKSTLLRAIAGLMPSQAGTVSWNGVPIDDNGAWMVPPQAAHLPQVPRLFSESLADNISLGRPIDRLDEVLALTTLSTDLADMPDGADTRVGARGLRLSGGQAQRVATARSLLPDPEVLLVDDLSSALDVETERALWHHVRSQQNTTVIAVSHRRFVLDMADQLITLEEGRVVG